MRIGIALGDVTGIGPEVTLKALATDTGSHDTSYLLIGDAGHANRLNQQLGLRLPLRNGDGADAPGCISVLEPLTEPLPEKLAPGAAEAANAAVKWLKEGASRCLRHELDALAKPSFSLNFPAPIVPR
jgi:4-hydroxy-L-threonine phosphate dehydrogenase PdxA